MIDVMEFPQWAWRFPKTQLGNRANWGIEIQLKVTPNVALRKILRDISVVCLIAPYLERIIMLWLVEYSWKTWHPK